MKQCASTRTEFCQRVPASINQAKQYLKSERLYKSKELSHLDEKNIVVEFEKLCAARPPDIVVKLKAEADPKKKQKSQTYKVEAEKRKREEENTPKIRTHEFSHDKSNSGEKYLTSRILL